MKKNTRHHHHVGTSQSNLGEKPYGFCCDVKDPKVDIQHGMGSLFSRHNLTGGGPSIKFRCQDVEALSTSIQRLTQRSVYRVGPRGRQRGRQRGGYNDIRHGMPGTSGMDRDNGRSWGNENNLRGKIKCKRCKGPLRQYLEDEIDAARDIMMKNRQAKHHRETELNIKVAKKKEKKKKK